MDIRDDYRSENRVVWSDTGMNYKEERDRIFKILVSVNVDWHGVFTDKKGV